MGTAATILAIIMAIAKDVPIVDGWIKQLTTAYMLAKIAKMDKANRDALKKAIEEGDQRDLEIAMGSSGAGEMSGVPGSVVVDKLPGVK